MEEISQGMLEDLIESGETLVVDFYASWCGPCKMMHPVFENESKQHTKVKFVRINVDEAYEFCMKSNIQSIPTFIVYEKGKEKKRTLGYMSPDDFHTFVELSLK